MADSTSQNAATGTGTTVVSAWQNDISVLRHVRRLSWKFLRPM
jgi:hypothetical protein